MNFNRLHKDMLQAAREYHEMRSTLGDDNKSFIESIYQDMHTLDAKSTGLITFISLTLAALTFALGLVDQKLEHAALIKAGIICFIGIFAAGAWFSLRCLEIAGPPFTDIPRDPETHKYKATAEIAARRYNYFVALKITRFAFTMLVPFIIIWLGLLVREFY